MRKENPQHRWHVTNAEKAKIRRLTKAGVRQAEIARRLNITAPSVSKAQRAMGLPTTLVWPEKKIVELFRKGWGGYRISKHLHVPANQVYAIAHKHGINNGWQQTAPENEARFIEALKRGDDYVKRLAVKHKVAFCRARRIAHEVLETIEFRPGLSKPPLSSNFPQRNFPSRIRQASAEIMRARQEQNFAWIVESIAEKFQGMLPPYPQIICDAVINALPMVRDASESFRQYFAEQLLNGLILRIAAQDVAAKSTFQN